MKSFEIYDELTAGRSRFLRVEELARLAGEKGHLPCAAELEAEAARPLKEKKGLEKRQGEFFADVLSDPERGAHLCHAMLLPHPDSQRHFKEFSSRGEIDLGGAHLKRVGKAAVITMKNPAYLNAEDEATLPGMELATDLALMDPQAAVCVLRGAPAEHPKHRGKRIFGSGINLTLLYEGKIRYLWYLIRDLGFVNKFYRGLAFPNKYPEQESLEKLWIAAVEGHAIGGHCQILLTMDYIIGAADAYLTLPARKEGIVPGAANLRLPRFVGDRIARRAVMADLRIDCADPAGKMICDEVVPPGQMDSTIEEVVQNLTTSGVVSAAGNRRAFRAGEEPLDAFRRYMAVYAREQAQCHLSPQLIANLERNWKKK